MTPEAIERLILKSIRSSRRRFTRPALQRRLMNRHGVTAEAANASVNALLQRNEIVYTSHFGCSFLEISYGRPVRVTASIVIKPPSCTYEADSGDVVIDLSAGAAFGGGRHPTTRLALAGLEFLFQNDRRKAGCREGGVLDIGTGSGILVIAAVKLGGAAGLGIDRDLCAVAEARENVAQNGLAGRIRVSDMPVEAVKGGYFLTMANLRLPTIERLFPLILKRTNEEGFILLSGIKAEELGAFRIDKQRTAGVEPLWQERSLGWGAVVLQKRPAAG